MLDVPVTAKHINQHNRYIILISLNLNRAGNTAEEIRLVWLTYRQFKDTIPFAEQNAYTKNNPNRRQ